MMIDFLQMSSTDTAEEPDIQDIDEGDEVETSEECQNLDKHMRKEINYILQSLQQDEDIKALVKDNRTDKQIDK